jgi:hypothetical protein
VFDTVWASWLHASLYIKIHSASITKTDRKLKRENAGWKEFFSSGSKPLVDRKLRRRSDRPHTPSTNKGKDTPVIKRSLGAPDRVLDTAGMILPIKDIRGSTGTRVDWNYDDRSGRIWNRLRSPKKWEKITSAIRLEISDPFK